MCWTTLLPRMLVVCLGPSSNQPLHIDNHRRRPDTGQWFLGRQACTTIFDDDWLWRVGVAGMCLGLLETSPIATTSRGSSQLGNVAFPPRHKQSFVPDLQVDTETLTRRTESKVHQKTEIVDTSDKICVGDDERRCCNCACQK